MPDRCRPDILYLTHRVPYPPDKGDRIRTFHMLKFLSRWARVHLAALADEAVDEGLIATLRSYCARVAVVRLRATRWVRGLASLVRGRTLTEGAFWSPRLAATVDSWADEMRFSACLASASSLVPYLRRRGVRNVPAVVDLIDVDSQKWQDYAEVCRGPRAWLYRVEGRRLKQLERGLPGWARAVTLAAEAEADLYRRFCLPGAVHAVTNGVDLDYFRPSHPSSEVSCTFVGALDYRPNIDGATWFCRTVWPDIVRRQPQAKLYLVGRRPAPAVCRLAGLPGVELVGQVPDVRPHLARSAIAVVPLRIARGIQNKVLEALAMGKAVIASPSALLGLAARPGTDLLRASSPAEWVEAVLGLFADQDLRLRLGSAGRRYVEEHHHWESCLGALPSLLGLAYRAPTCGSDLAPAAG
jgi:sugar transferase (PEP-CTERM/EpsH1 system associated)